MKYNVHPVCSVSSTFTTESCCTRTDAVPAAAAAAADDDDDDDSAKDGHVVGDKVDVDIEFVVC